MNRSSRLTLLLLLAIVIPCFVPAGSAQPSMDSITIYLDNHSTFNHTYTITMIGCRPGCCGSPTWATAIAAGQTVPIGLCSNHALTDGYGEFKYHSEDTSTWTDEPLKRNGEHVAM
jgi:hypothetical protein